MIAPRHALKAAWDNCLGAVGIVLLVLIGLVWALVAPLLHLVLPERTGRRVGRVAVMCWFRFYLAVMEGLGAWRLDLSALDGLREEGALIIAPNHPCLLDAVLVVSRLPNAVCVMKGSLLRNFLLGPAARLARYVPNDSLLRLLTSAGGELRLGGQLVLFPEGTRSTAQPIGPFTEAVGALSRRSGVPVQTLIIEADASFLGKGWTLAMRPELPLTYRLRLGRRFEPPRDVRAFTAELERYFTRDLAAREVEDEVPAGAHPVDAHRLRG